MNVDYLTGPYFRYQLMVAPGFGFIQNRHNDDKTKIRKKVNPAVIVNIQKVEKAKLYFPFILYKLELNK